jgi:hypothetical protein
LRPRVFAPGNPALMRVPVEAGRHDYRFTIQGVPVMPPGVRSLLRVYVKISPIFYAFDCALSLAYYRADSPSQNSRADCEYPEHCDREGDYHHVRYKCVHGSLLL